MLRKDSPTPGTWAHRAPGNFSINPALEVSQLVTAAGGDGRLPVRIAVWTRAVDGAGMWGMGIGVCLLAFGRILWRLGGYAERGSCHLREK